MEETRHKHQMQYQHVDWQMVTPTPTVASEPKRISNLTTVTALKSLPNSAITWCNENAFDISICNAQKNIELWRTTTITTVRPDPRADVSWACSFLSSV